MKEIYITTRHWQDEEGRPRQFHYFLTVEEVDTGRFCCEDYGVRITEDEQNSVTLPSLTTSAFRMDQLMTLLVDNLVGPIGLPDVVADWL